MAKKKEYKDFEGAMARLEEIIALLESSESTLEESIALYTEGIEIAGTCSKKLAEAEGRIAKLVKAAGQFKLESFGERDDDE